MKSETDTLLYEGHDSLIYTLDKAHISYVHNLHTSFRFENPLIIWIA